MTMLGPGMYTQRTGPCDDCQGKGEIISEASKCKKCKGMKTKKDVKVFDVSVDKGAPHGEKYVIHGEGDEIPDAEAGDVEVTVAIKPHKKFKRKGADLLMQKDITLIEALTGVDFTFEHLDGRKIRVKTEEGAVIKPNSLMTLKDLGMPFHKTTYQSGNLFVMFKVEFPDTLKPAVYKNLTDALGDCPKNPEEKSDEIVELETFHENQKNTHV